METYDPYTAPDPQEWLALSEPNRFELVTEYLTENEPRVEGAMIHVAIHVMVETQAALGDQTNVAYTLERLQDEGLDRHEAIHAIGLIFAELMMESGGTQFTADDYTGALDRLSASAWLEMTEERKNMDEEEM
ncbi:hypothetical protein [Sulfuriroseicoccus oceanibius]|uniref:DUF1841 family protein n=1 Tax=Sulfuriroseicoccus oceanibius TaxID=2707525 RepID=A0A6B3L4X4_9BACT|nr:hypothetical protein [Sulfuriroseicoccus oceanibius]QQL44452.1 hypothetical protein G3M56_011230 [Sulfuriroseicoccus oceanibius]